MEFGNWNLEVGIWNCLRIRPSVAQSLRHFVAQYLRRSVPPSLSRFGVVCAATGRGYREECSQAIADGDVVEVKP